MVSRKEFIHLAVAALFSPQLKSLEKIVSPPEIEDFLNHKELLSDPNFFTTPIGNQTIFTKQFNPQEYNPDFPEALMNNSCGPASIATILKLFTYFKYEKVPSVRIQDVLDFLNSHDHPQKESEQSFLQYDGTMRFLDIKTALDLYSQKGVPLNTVEIPGVQIPSYSTPNAVFPKEKYSQLIKDADQLVFQKGGVLMAFFWKYGYGHFSIFSKMDFFPNSTHPRVLVVDPRGHKTPLLSGGNHSGIVEETSLLYYLEDPHLPGYPEDMLFSVFGVIPK